MFFMTGATGFIGTALIPELIGAGHQVLGLTRSEAGAEALKAAGADVHHGSLEDLDSLKSGAAAVDGVIHLAFIHNFSKFEENCEIDRRAIAALGSVLKGSNRPLIVTGGTGIVGAGPARHRRRQARIAFPARVGCGGGGARRGWGQRDRRAASAGSRHFQTGPRHLCDRDVPRKRGLRLRGGRASEMAGGACARCGAPL